MTNLPQTQNDNPTAVAIKNIMVTNMKAITSVLPKHLTPERVLRMTYTALQRTPKLMTCDQLSLVNAMLEASMLGLEINTPQHLCTILPYKGKAQLIVEYRGKIALAYQSPNVSHFSAHAVFEQDGFDYEYGTEQKLYHKPYSGKEDRGELIAAYAQIKYKDGAFDFEVIHQADADQAKSFSPSKGSSYSPWNVKEHIPAMWVKTAIHRLSKRVPQCPELHLATKFESAQDIGQHGAIDMLPNFEYTAPLTASDDINSKIGEEPTETKTTEPDTGSNAVIEAMTVEQLKTEIAALSEEEQVAALQAADFTNMPTGKGSLQKVLLAHVNAG